MFHSIGRHEYKFDLSMLTQTNTATNISRAIRVVSHHDDSACSCCAQLAPMLQLSMPPGQVRPSIVSVVGRALSSLVSDREARGEARGSSCLSSQLGRHAFALMFVTFLFLAMVIGASVSSVAAGGDSERRLSR